MAAVMTDQSPVEADQSVDSVEEEGEEEEGDDLIDHGGPLCRWVLTGSANFSTVAWVRLPE